MLGEERKRGLRFVHSPGSDLCCFVLIVREQSTTLFHNFALLFPAILVTPAEEKMP
jgi:hypothetical protein